MAGVCRHQDPGGRKRPVRERRGPDLLRRDLRRRLLLRAGLQRRARQPRGLHDLRGRGGGRRRDLHRRGQQLPLQRRRQLHRLPQRARLLLHPQRPRPHPLLHPVRHDAGRGHGPGPQPPGQLHHPGRQHHPGDLLRLVASGPGHAAAGRALHHRHARPVHQAGRGHPDRRPRLHGARGHGGPAGARGLRRQGAPGGQRRYHPGHAGGAVCHQPETRRGKPHDHGPRLHRL